MIETLSQATLSSLSDFLVAQMGLHFPPNRTTDLARGIRAATKEFGFDSPEACVDWLISSPLSQRQIEILASQLTVGETYFFRERQTFRALEDQVLPGLLKAHAADRRLRVWSAGCATGEEPYSLAIMLAKLIPKFGEWNISIQGSDINPRFLQTASAGAYTKWSFRDCPAEVKETYFKEIDEGRLELKPEIRKMVAFSYVNLVEDQYPSLLNETNALDIIFCRNVLMYFGSEQAKRVIQRFHRCLLYGGWLVVSSTEASHILYSQFTTVNFPGAILYRKDQEAALHLDLQTLRGDNESARINQPASGFGDPPSAGNSIIPSLLETAKPWTANLPKAEPPQTLPVDPFGLYEDGRYSEAAEAATALLSDEPKNKKAMILLARILANQGQLVQALEWCEKAIAAEKLNPGSYYLRAIILQEQGGISEAANSLKQALYLDHGFVLAQFVLGNLHRQMGKPRDADKNFQNVRSLLKGYRNDETLPESEGITAGRLREIMERLAIANS